MIDKAAYLRFLESKIDNGGNDAQIDFDFSQIHPSTFPHQRDAIMWALKQQCALIAMSFGLGKTQIETEIARLLVNGYTDRKFLLVCPLGVRHQFIEMDGPRLGINWRYVYNDEQLRQSSTPFCVTNYEAVRDGRITPSKHNLIGVSLDEGSVMRSLGTKTVEVYLSAFKDVPYRFVATATPCPNNYREIIYYADFLGIMDHGQALTRWFKRNPNKAGDLQIHPQHEREFWLWVSTWALFLYRPSDMGYSDEGYELPPLNVHWHRIGVDHARAFQYTDNRGQHKLLVDATGSVSQLAHEKRATLPDRVAKMKEIIDAEPKEHWLLWHNLEDERRAIEMGIPKSISVFGSLDLDERERRVMDFSNGRIPILATKPELSGSGCNFQRHCHKNVFLGIDYKFEDFVQAIHRTHRFQQTEPVDVHIIYAESEDLVAQALRRKWEQYDALVDNMRQIIREYGLDHKAIDEILKRKIGVKRMETISERFMASNNDCVLEMPNLPDNSVGLIHTSIPFGNHYEYTTQVEDMGHNEDNARFFEQMDFLIPELLRVLKPGRVCAVHVKDRVLYKHQTASGITEIDPFSDLTREAFCKRGFLYEGRRTIVTDVVRENNSTYRLGWSEMTEGDAAKMGSGLPEYLLLFRKRPTLQNTVRADEPVRKSKADYTRGRWQITAHSFWQSDGNVAVPQKPEEQVRFLLDLLMAKDPYDFEAHVKRLEDLDAKGNLPSSYFCEPPESHNTWVWDDVTFMRCLNSSQSRRKEANHICPLPFDIVERVIQLYSNPGDVVLDPFAGLFTVPYCAIKLGRIGWGIELSPEYYADGVYYCQQIEQQVTMPTLFDLMAFTVPERVDA